MCCFLQIITLLLLSNIINCSITTQYYEELIRQNFKATENYESSQRNEEFSKGFQQTVTTELRPRDFIIVGSGSAGSVLATRLSEIDNFDILVLEAGGEEDDFSKIPGHALYTLRSDKNWGYQTTPQKYSCLGTKTQRCSIPRGKVLGGTSSINHLVYTRGNAEDYNSWAELGNTGWAFKDVLPYFLKSENSEINGNFGYHGKGGFWNVEYALPTSPVVGNFINGSLEFSQANEDYNGIKQLGLGQVQFNTKCGVRQSTATAFLNNARKRRNLEVITGALATKIIIDSDTKTATGVEFITRRGKYKVKANKEVISCAGAINSPQLLMLSGIGPRDHLEKTGIKVLEDVPVGKNLFDHPLISLVIQTNNTLPKAQMTETIAQYLNGLGPLTKANGYEGIGFIYAGNHQSSVPTIQFVFKPPAGGSTTILSKIWNYKEELDTNFVKKINLSADVLISVILLHQKSKGRITLNSTSPIDFPNIDLNMLSKQDDVDTLIAGIDFFQKVLQTDALKKLDAKFLDIPICNEFVQYSKSYWECFIRYTIAITYHPCCTTAMGPDRKNSVVDRNLKVHGIKKLRVVDAGAFPTLTSGNLNAPVVMVAEKMADQIKTEYRIH